METTTLLMFNQTVRYENSLIWIKPVCELFNLSVQNQHRKLKKDAVLGKLWTNLSTVFPESGPNDDKMSTDLGVIDKNGRLLLTKKGFARWINLINPNAIDPDLRDKFIIYQEMVFDFLYGSVADDHQTRVNYNRLKKLERLQGIISNEIKRTKKDLQEHWNTRYLQTSLHFPERKQINP